MSSGQCLPVIVDCDAAIDDWIAILYLLASPSVDVRAITVCGTGQSHSAAGLRTIERLLALAGCEHIPVAVGRATPLNGSATFPRMLRFAVDHRLGLRIPARAPEAPRRAARDVLADALAQAAQPVTLVTLGPLTNIGELLHLRPELRQQIGTVVAMGGALAAPGNIPTLSPRIDNPFAEWNFYIDPYAAETVLQSGLAVTLVPLDATNRLPITDAFVERLGEMPQRPEAAFIQRALRRLMWLIGRRPYYFADPVAAVLVTNSCLATFNNYHLRVVTEPGSQYGRTVERPDGQAITVCVDVDQNEFEDLLAHTIKGQPALLQERAVGI